MGTPAYGRTTRTNNARGNVLKTGSACIVSVGNYDYRMQTSDRDLSGPEASPSGMPEVLSESSPAPAKSTAFDLFNLVLSYKRLEIYLGPLKDAGDGVRYLLRYRLPLGSPVSLVFSSSGQLGSSWAVPSALVMISSGETGCVISRFIQGYLCSSSVQERWKLRTT